MDYDGKPQNLTEIFNSWDGYTIYCQTKNQTEIEIYGNDAMNLYASMTFQVHKCVNSTDNEGTCANPEEINKFISRIQINTWANYLESEFTIHPDLPVKRIEKFKKQDLLDP